MQFIRRKKPDGYKELLVYRRAEELQTFIYEITEKFSINERRRKEHMRDSARSVKQNIVEGWKRETTRQYIDFLSYSFGSLGELKEDGKDCLKFEMITQKEFDELIRRCGEVDYLMGRLKDSLERKIKKEEVLSPYQKWLGQQMEKEREETKRFDREVLKKEGLVFTKEGVMKKEEAERRGLEEIELT